MRLIYQIGNRSDCRNELTSKSDNAFQDMKEYFIKMNENINKFFLTKNYFKIYQPYCG